VSKNPTTPYTTRVQLAAPPDMAVQFHKWLCKCTDFQILGETLTDGSNLPENIRISRPDILLLDALLPRLDMPAVLTVLGSSRVPPYVVVTAPRYDPYLAQTERYKVVKGALPHRLAASPLLVPVLKGIVEGHEYFAPDPLCSLLCNELTPEDTILLALMAIGVQVNDLALTLGCTNHMIYTAQCRLRKKLGVEINEQAILVAIRRKLVAMMTDPSDRVFKEIA
jgi:DNA-binding NarL/FixJ family response regulator